MVGYRQFFTYPNNVLKRSFRFSRIAIFKNNLSSQSFIGPKS